jgi:hypothetical protein
MSQRNGGYQRKCNDAYQTPPWVTQTLCNHLPCSRIHTIWEPAQGCGFMVKELRAYGFDVIGTDLATGTNFLDQARTDCQAIITNPPFGLAEEFIKHSLDMMAPCRGIVAMLARIDYDSAATRRYLFADHRAFAKKLVLTKRIVWFEKKGAAPSFNHCWLIWDWRHIGPPSIAYGP